jgi:hypothetical protein
MAVSAMPCWRGIPDNEHMYPLHLKHGHLFVQIDNELWLLDTGSPESFGERSALCMQGRVFQLPKNYQGMSVADLSGYTQVECVGLIGADIIGLFDLLIDVPAGLVDFMTESTPFDGREISVAHFMGIPVIETMVAGQPVEMFFDTGSQLTYVQDGILQDFPEAGLMQDFYHGYGEFNVNTHFVPVVIGQRPYNVRCGELPGLLGDSVLSKGPRGIMGTEWLTDCRIGYFPGRGVIVIDPVPLAGYRITGQGGDPSYVVH